MPLRSHLVECRTWKEVQEHCRRTHAWAAQFPVPVLTLIFDYARHTSAELVKLVRVHRTALSNEFDLDVRLRRRWHATPTDDTLLLMNAIHAMLTVFTKTEQSKACRRVFQDCGPVRINWQAEWKVQNRLPWDRADSEDVETIRARRRRKRLSDKRRNKRIKHDKNGDNDKDAPRSQALHSHSSSSEEEDDVTWSQAGDGHWAHTLHSHSSSSEEEDDDNDQDSDGSESEDEIDTMEEAVTRLSLSPLPIDAAHRAWIQLPSQWAAACDIRDAWAHTNTLLWLDLHYLLGELGVPFIEAREHGQWNKTRGTNRTMAHEIRPFVDALRTLISQRSSCDTVSPAPRRHPSSSVVTVESDDDDVAVPGPMLFGLALRHEPNATGAPFARWPALKLVYVNCAKTTPKDLLLYLNEHRGPMNEQVQELDSKYEEWSKLCNSSEGRRVPLDRTMWTVWYRRRIYVAEMVATTRLLLEYEPELRALWKGLCITLSRLPGFGLGTGGRVRVPVGCTISQLKHYLASIVVRSS